MLCNRPQGLVVDRHGAGFMHRLGVALDQQGLDAGLTQDVASVSPVGPAPTIATSQARRPQLAGPLQAVSL